MKQDVGSMADDPTMSDLTYEQALATVLALVGERVEVHVLDAGESPHHVATFGGRLRAGYSTTGGEPTDTEAILLRFDAGEESAGLSLDRELFGGAIGRDDGSLTIQLGDVSFVILRRE
jgi:hypothetical protein